ncbi:MAG: phospho-sugar mutase, partial [Chlamydiae bacterium]|nr:phospho-sugar mutase [Chlamydiota bacterium]
MIQARIREWLDGPYDEETKREIQHLLQTNPESLQDAFFKNLSFGTGGLRAKMGVGTNRLNRYTVQIATQGLANYLLKQGEKKISVFIGYDVRDRSREFAIAAARVLAGNHIETLLTDAICPTPLVSFGCRHFSCQAAIMITASHNPPEYNGYKVFWNDGGQVVAPHDQGILQEVQKIAGIDEVQLAPPDSPLIRLIDNSLDEAYLNTLAACKLHKKTAPLKIFYTPLHGTGIRILPKALQSWGFSCSHVEKQSDPNGKFPHAASVNPEEKEAFELGSELLIKEKGDLLLATDPDADRVGAAILHAGNLIHLTGNQIACLCLDHICRTLAEKKELSNRYACIKTIVTTELFAHIAESYGLTCFNVLTGFKYIAAQIAEWEKTDAPYQYLFGGEESYGYLFQSFVRDKDAISSSCLIAEAAASAKEQGKTLLDELYTLYERFGVYRQLLTNLSLPSGKAGLEAVSQIMDRLRNTPPLTISGQKVVQIDDYLAS